MKKLYSLFMFLLLAGLTAQAATNYGIKVAGVSVTSDNASNIHGSNISGTVTYNNSTKTLTMTNVTINLTSGSDRALLNTGCSGLTVKFVGTCTLKTTNKAPIRTETNTYLYAPSSSTVVNVTGVNEGAIFMAGDNHTLQIVGPGKFNINTTKCPAIEGAESSGQLTSGYFVEFYDVTAELYSPENALRRLYGVKFHESSHITFKATNNADYSIATSIQGFVFYGNEAVLSPYGAYASNSAGSFLDSSGNRIKNQNVYISDNYAFIINATNFPSAYFREAMLELYPKGYLTQTEVQNLTSLNVQTLGIDNMKGVELMPYLKTLRCNNNCFTSLDLSNNTRLTELYCFSNNMSSLNVSNCTQLTTLHCAYNSLTSLNLLNLSALVTLNCYNNQLTSITFASSMPNLQTVNCYNNNFTVFSLTGYHALKTLNIKNCTSLNKLTCYNNALTSLDVTGNTALTYLDCATNTNLTMITGLSTCTAMNKLYCYNCSLNDLSAVSNMNNLQILSCYDNKISSLTLQGKSQLTTVSCYNNPYLTTATITGNAALTSLNISNCTALTNLKCHNNALTTLNVTGNTSLLDLRCYYNANLRRITGLAGCTALTYLDCEDCAIDNLLDVNQCSNITKIFARNNQLTGLSVYAKPQLTTLRVSGNTSLHMLMCASNALTSLDISNCPAMDELDCSANHNLTTITGLEDLSNIEKLYVSNCNFSSLNVANKTKLADLRCYSNNLTTLDLSGCSALTRLDCSLNKINGDGMTNLINSLPWRTSSNPGTFYAIHNSANEENVMTRNQAANCKAKSWLPMRFNGNEWVIILTTMQYDVNGDGSVSIADVTYLISLLLNGGDMPDAADINEDGNVSIADVTTLIALLLNN